MYLSIFLDKHKAFPFLNENKNHNNKKEDKTRRRWGASHQHLEECPSSHRSKKRNQLNLSRRNFHVENIERKKQRK